MPDLTDNPTQPVKPAIAVRSVEYGTPSDMPEVNWLWRRIFIFAVTTGAAYELDKQAMRVTEQARLHDIVRLLIALVALMALLYIAGASSEAITRLIGAIKTSRKETVSSAVADSISSSTTATEPTTTDVTATSNTGGQLDDTQPARAPI